MSIVKIKDKTFKTSIPEAEILKKVQVVADRLNKDYAGKKPVFLAGIERRIYLCSRLDANDYRAKRDFIREVCFLRGYLLYGQHEDPDGFEPGFGRPPRGYC